MPTNGNASTENTPRSGGPRKGPKGWRPKPFTPQLLSICRIVQFAIAEEIVDDISHQVWRPALITRVKKNKIIDCTVFITLEDCVAYNYKTTIVPVCNVEPWDSKNKLQGTYRFPKLGAIETGHFVPKEERN